MNKSGLFLVTVTYTVAVALFLKQKGENRRARNWITFSLAISTLAFSLAVLVLFIVIS